MNIERNKWYVLRNGEKVRVVCVDAPGKFPVVVLDAVGMSWHYTQGGKPASATKDHDIIREHREPARVWVNIYRNGNHSAYDSAAEAHENHGAHATRIAVEFVEVVK